MRIILFLALGLVACGATFGADDATCTRETERLMALSQRAVDAEGPGWTNTLHVAQGILGEAAHLGEANRAVKYGKPIELPTKKVHKAHEVDGLLFRVSLGHVLPLSGGPRVRAIRQV